MVKVRRKPADDLQGDPRMFRRHLISLAALAASSILMASKPKLV
jgi:hypothetical protein